MAHPAGLPRPKPSLRGTAARFTIRRPPQSPLTSRRPPLPDLDAYFARIGYTGPRAPDLTTLAAIHALHPRAIPFETLDPYLGQPVSIDPGAVQAKLVGSRRGGYCFEQNTLFKLVLEALGFGVTVLSARVIWLLPEGAPAAPRGHMALRVRAEGVDHIADVGFGGMLSAAPVPFPADGEAMGAEQPVPGGALRVRREGGLHFLEAVSGAGWRAAYCFTLEPQAPVDMEVANWYMSTHPASRFRNVLVLQRLLPDGRITLQDRAFARRTARGPVEEREIGDVAEFERIIREEFGIDPPAGFEAAFARLA
jgi:N-hydroxyarylamine O-acetyltransferase